MTINRRRLLKMTGLLAAGSSFGWLTKAVWAQRPAAAFDTDKMDEALQSVLAGATPVEGSIELDAPEIAENGAVVPITVSTSLEGVESISVLVDKNPRPLISTFFILDQMEPYVAVRVKMRETSDVVAVAKTANGFYIAKKPVKVTAGGCG